MGMTYEQFWYGDPWMAKDYRTAYEIRRDEKNFELWLQGVYIYEAVGAVVAQFGGDEKAKYLKKPIDLREKTEEEERQEVVDYLTKLQETFNANHENTSPI